MIPIASTTIKVYRVTETEPGEGRTSVLLASGIRANIGALNGIETGRPGGGQLVVSGRFQCDPTDLIHTDQIVDETTLETFEVRWVKRKYGLGFDHLEGECLVVQGAVA